jgi:hypothetical protein
MGEIKQAAKPPRALTFRQNPKSAGEGMYESQNCDVPSCNSSGRHTFTILGYPQGVICTKHRTEMTKSWDASRPLTIAAYEQATTPAK